MYDTCIVWSISLFPWQKLLGIYSGKPHIPSLQTQCWSYFELTRAAGIVETDGETHRQLNSERERERDGSLIYVRIVPGNYVNGNCYHLIEFGPLICHLMRVKPRFVIFYFLFYSSWKTIVDFTKNYWEVRSKGEPAALCRRMPRANRLFLESMKGKILNFYMKLRKWFR